MRAIPRPPRRPASLAVGIVLLVATVASVTSVFLIPGATGTENAASVTPGSLAATVSPSLTPGTQIVTQGHAAAVSVSIPSSGTPPYSWQWLFSLGGSGAYAPAGPAQCASPDGSGAMPGAVETCSFATTGTTLPGTYYFELRVTDSATEPESVTSPVSSTITVERGNASSGGSVQGAPAFQTDPQEDCTGGCTDTNWFGGTRGSGNLAITTASANELLVLEITDSGQTGADLSAADVSDTQGSTWTLESTNEWDGAGHFQYVFYAIDATAAADTITVDTSAGTHTGATDATAVLSAFSGVDTSAPIAAIGTFGTGTGTQSSASVTTHVSPTTILGVVSTTDGSSAFTATSSPAFTEAGTINDGAATASFVEYYAASATGTYTSEPTWTGSVRWGAVAIAVQGASPLSVTVAPTTVTLDQGQSVTETATATGGTGTLSYTWSIASGSCPGFTNSGTATLSYSPSGTTTNCVLTVTVEDADDHTAQPATTAAVTVNTELATPATPTISAAALDVNQPETITGTIPSSGTPTYGWTWLVSTSGSGYATETECAVNSGTGAAAGATETCALAANRLTAGDTYNFELKVTDSATTAETVTSAASATVTVASALAAPGAPTVSATKLDLNQALTVGGTIPTSGTTPYAWTWLASVDGGTYATATVCATDGGTGASAGATESCVVGGGDLTAGDTYNFELQVDDGASTPEAVTSAASSTVTVSSQLTAPAAPTVSAAALDVNQAETITGTIPSTGTATYAWTWLVAIGGGAYSDTSQCGTNSGTGATAGATETCVIAASTLTAGDSYAFELEITDSATSAETTTSPASPSVAVSSTLVAPAAPTVSAAALDLNQAETVSGTIPTTGTAPYAWTWLVSVDGGTYGTATECATNSGTGATGGAGESCAIGASDLVAGDTYSFEFEVKDSASSAETVTSAASTTITVKPTLTAPAAPSIGAAKIDRNQAETVTGTIPTTGTAPYAWTWMVSVNGGAYAAATQCATNSGTGAAAGATETCAVAANGLTAGDTYTFELKVTDGATTPETATSAASGSVTVASQLAAPAAPTTSAAKLDANQALTVTDAIPTSGTSTYAWQWLVSVNAGAYADATTCVTNSGSGAAAGATETCLNAANALTAGSSYAFELKVTDSATTPETTTSAATGAVAVNSALAAPGTPTLSATALDVDQAFTVAGTVPSTGTSPYAWTWLVSVNGGAYATATECAVDGGTGASAGAVETCSIPGNTLTSGTSLTFELSTSDSATVAETATSAATSAVSVASALTAPAAPVPNATGIDLSTVLGVSGTIPSSGSSTYSWQWLLSENGGAYADASACGSSASGTGAAAAAVVTCTVPAETLTGGANYTFELEVTDSASSPESATSSASVDVAVSSDLVGGSPSPATAVLDDGQSVVLSADAAGGSGSDTYQWYSGATAAACVALGSPISGATGSTYSADPSSTTYYCYVVEDSDGDAVTSGSALLTVNSALLAPSAPAVSATALDSNQALTVTATLPDAGTAPYTWEWLVSVDGAGGVAATQCATNSGDGAAADATETCSVAVGALTIGDSYAFALEITDASDAGPETATSSLSHAIAVSAALAAPAVPTLSGSTLLLSETLTVSGTLPSTGAPALAWQWLISTDGGAFEDATVCGSSASGSGGAAGATVTCTVAPGALVPGDSYTFELEVTDSASVAESATSAASATVTVARPAVTDAIGQGPAGASYAVSGSGFSASGLVTVSFGSSALVPVACSEGTFSGSAITTDANGEFDCTFRVPALAAGAYSITAVDEASSSSTVALSFTITTPNLLVTPTTGAVGSMVTVSGTGFSVSTPLASLLFDSEAVTACLSGSLTANATGAFSCTFEVPSGTTGSTVVATDAGGATADAAFAAILPAAAPSTFGSWIWVALVAVLVAVLLIVVIARRRRTTARTGVGPTDESPVGPAALGATLSPAASGTESPPSSSVPTSSPAEVLATEVPVPPAPVAAETIVAAPPSPEAEPQEAPVAAAPALPANAILDRPEETFAAQEAAPSPSSEAPVLGHDPEAVARIVFPELATVPPAAVTGEAPPGAAESLPPAEGEVAPLIPLEPTVPIEAPAAEIVEAPIPEPVEPMPDSVPEPSPPPATFPPVDAPPAPEPVPDPSSAGEVPPEPLDAPSETVAAPSESAFSPEPTSFGGADPRPTETGAVDSVREDGTTTEPWPELPATEPEPASRPEDSATVAADEPSTATMHDALSPDGEPAPPTAAPGGPAPAPSADLDGVSSEPSLDEAPAEPSAMVPSPESAPTIAPPTDFTVPPEGPAPESAPPEPELPASPTPDDTPESSGMGPTPAEPGPADPSSDRPAPGDAPAAPGVSPPVPAGPLAAARLSTFFMFRPPASEPPAAPPDSPSAPPVDEPPIEPEIAPAPAPNEGAEPTPIEAPPSPESSCAPEPLTAEGAPESAAPPVGGDNAPEEPPVHVEFPSFHSVPAPRAPPKDPPEGDGASSADPSSGEDGASEPPAEDPS